MIDEQIELKIQEKRTIKVKATIGEFDWSACADCKHGGHFFEQGCAKKVILADVELGIIYCDKFKDKNAGKYERRRKFKRKQKNWNAFVPPNLAQGGYE